MRVSVYNNGTAVTLDSVRVTKRPDVWIYHLYMRELSPFGEVYTQGNNSFIVWYKAALEPGGKLHYTGVKFKPETDEEREWVQREILVSRGKLLCPQDVPKETLYCQRVYLIRGGEPDHLQTPVSWEKTDYI